MNTTDKVQFLQDIFSCNYNLHMWVYDQNLELVDSDCKDHPIYSEIFSISGCRENLLPMNEAGMPLILSDTLNMVWIAIYHRIDGKLKNIYVLGPVFTTEISFMNIGHILDTRQLSPKLKKIVLDRLKEIPIISSTLYFQYALMMHYALSGEKISYSDLEHFSSGNVTDTIVSSNEDTHKGVWGTEQALLKMVEEGNKDYHSALHNATLVSYGVKIYVKDSIRQAKISVITFISLCTRAAIRGGLSPDTAYTVGDYYIQSVEEASQFTEIASISHLMYEDFINRVYNCKKNVHISLPIQSCCDYIRLNICEKIQIKDLAEKVSYTEYYLTRKFKKEVGISINEYIQTQKIEHAKLLLSTSSETIQHISDLLNFCSRSYFSEVFLKIEGISPSEYREQNKRI
jgi:AraC-like DNA-binding protein